MTGWDRDTLPMILAALCKYARDELPPDYLLELDAQSQFPRQVIEDLYNPARLGLHLLFIPEEYGGLGASVYDIYRVSETLAAIDLGLATSALATFLGIEPIKVGGTPEQQAHWMTRLAKKASLAAFAATEPEAGSDLAALRTRAEPVYENGRLAGYKLCGRKQWISNGGVASFYTVLANAPGGPSWFIVEQDAPGLAKGKPEDKHGLRTSNTTALFLHDVLVPPDRLIGGQEGQGLIQARAVFGYSRLMVAAFGLGAGWEALRRANAYSKERIQAGAPLCQKPGYTHKLLVPNAVALEAARAYVEWIAERLDQGESDLYTESAIAKYAATEAGNRAAEDAIQAHGGYGYSREYMVEKIKRDVRITTIYEGTSEMMEWTIARDRGRLHWTSHGACYNDWAARLEQLQQAEPDSGAGTAALALRALATILERARSGRLVSHQHVLFRMGELAACAETAAAFSERVTSKPTQAIALDGATRQAMARLYARQAALKVAGEGLRWTMGAESEPDWIGSLNLQAIYQAQAGLVKDMDSVAQGLQSLT